MSMPHVSWCMPVYILAVEAGGEEKVPGIPGLYSTSSFLYLVRGQETTTIIKKTHISIHVYCTGHIVGVNVVNRSNDIRNAPVLLYCDAGLYSFMLCSIECGFVLCCASFSWCDVFCSHEIHSFNPSIILIVGSLALTISHKWTESDEDW